MNQTEAWIEALQEAHAFPKLGAALKKVKPRVERMRSRLDFARAKTAGKLNRPSWATP